MENARGFGSPLDKDEPCCVSPDDLKEWTEKYTTQRAADMLFDLITKFISD